MGDTTKPCTNDPVGVTTGRSAASDGVPATSSVVQKKSPVHDLDVRRALRRDVRFDRACPFNSE